MRGLQLSLLLRWHRVALRQVQQRPLQPHLLQGYEQVTEALLQESQLSHVQSAAAPAVPARGVRQRPRMPEAWAPAPALQPAWAAHQRRC